MKKFIFIIPIGLSFNVFAAVNCPDFIALPDVSEFSGANCKAYADSGLKKDKDKEKEDKNFQSKFESKENLEKIQAKEKRIEREKYDHFFDLLKKASGKKPSEFKKKDINDELIEKTLKSVGDNIFSKNDLNEIKKSMLEIASSSRTDYLAKRTPSLDTIKVDKQARDVYKNAYDDFVEEIKLGYELKIDEAKNKGDKERVRELEKIRDLKIKNITFKAPKVISMTPPNGMNVSEFLELIQRENPSYFNCSHSLGYDKSGIWAIDSINDGDSEEGKNTVKPNKDSTPSYELKTKDCEFGEVFADDSFTPTEAMGTKIKECLKDVKGIDPSDVEIKIESCASTVRSSKFKQEDGNLILAMNRCESLAELVNSFGAKYENIEKNYFGKNNVPGEIGLKKYTGTCGPYITKISDRRLAKFMELKDANMCKIPHHALDCFTKTDKEKFETPYNEEDSYSWLCSYANGEGYQHNSVVYKDLEKYRYNKITITYKVPKISPSTSVEKESTPPTFSPVPSIENKEYVLSRPHVTCLEPSLKTFIYNSNATSGNSNRRKSWLSFSEWLETKMSGTRKSGGSPTACYAF